MLIKYCIDGNLEKVKNYYAIKRHVNSIDDSKTTPLMHASASGYIDIVKILVENGAKLNLKNIHGYTALIRACINNHPEVIKYLIYNDADVNICDNDGDSPLILASKLGNEEIIRMLINKKANIHHLNKKNQNCLLVSSFYYYMTYAFFLILLGVDPEIKDNYYKKNSYDLVANHRDQININSFHEDRPRITKNMKDQIRKLMKETRAEYLELKRRNDNWNRRRNFIMCLRVEKIIPLKSDININIILDNSWKTFTVPRNMSYLIRQVFAYNSRKINKSSKDGCDLLELIISFI